MRRGSPRRWSQLCVGVENVPVSLLRALRYAAQCRAVNQQRGGAVGRGRTDSARATAASPSWHNHHSISPRHTSAPTPARAAARRLTRSSRHEPDVGHLDGRRPLCTVMRIRHARGTGSTSWHSTLHGHRRSAGPCRRSASAASLGDRADRAGLCVPLGTSTRGLGPLGSRWQTRLSAPSEYGVHPPRRCMIDGR